MDFTFSQHMLLGSRKWLTCRQTPAATGMTGMTTSISLHYAFRHVTTTICTFRVTKVQWRVLCRLHVIMGCACAVFLRQHLLNNKLNVDSWCRPIAREFHIGGCRCRFVLQVSRRFEMSAYCPPIRNRYLLDVVRVH